MGLAGKSPTDIYHLLRSPQWLKLPFCSAAFKGFSQSTSSKHAQSLFLSLYNSGYKLYKSDQ